MMTKLEKLIDALTALAKEATAYLEKENGKPYQPSLPMAVKEYMDNAAKAVVDQMDKVAAEAVAATAAPAVEEVAQKKVRKPRTPKPAPVEPQPEFTPEQEAAIADAPETAAAADLEAALNPAPTAPAALPPAPTADEIEESREEALTVARRYVEIAKNDKPASGYDQVKALLTKLNLGKITDLNHAQRLDFIATINGWLDKRK